MNIRNIFPSLLVGLLLCSSQMGAFEQTNHGVVIPISHQTQGGPALVRIQVMGENLIHVSATPENQFNDRTSLIILNPLKQTPSRVYQNKDTVVVATSRLKAYVLTSTGEVWFTDAQGKTILREKNGGGKTFQPITVDGTHERKADSTVHIPWWSVSLHYHQLSRSVSVYQTGTCLTYRMGYL